VKHNGSVMVSSSPMTLIDVVGRLDLLRMPRFALFMDPLR